MEGVPSTVSKLQVVSVLQNKARRRASFVGSDANPLTSADSSLAEAAGKLENLSDCKNIDGAALANLMESLGRVKENDSKVLLIEEAKVPFLFSSLDLMQVCSPIHPHPRLHIC